jgi:hypothetical protein
VNNLGLREGFYLEKGYYSSTGAVSNDRAAFFVFNS